MEIYKRSLGHIGIDESPTQFKNNSQHFPEIACNKSPSTSVVQHCRDKRAGSSLLQDNTITHDLRVFLELPSATVALVSWLYGC